MIRKMSPRYQAFSSLEGNGLLFPRTTSSICFCDLHEVFFGVQEEPVFSFSTDRYKVVLPQGHKLAVNGHGGLSGNVIADTRGNTPDSFRPVTSEPNHVIAANVLREHSRTTQQTTRVQRGASIRGLNKQWTAIQVHSTIQDRLSGVIKYPTGEFALIVHQDLQRPVQVSVDPSVSLSSSTQGNRLRSVSKSRTKGAGTSATATDTPRGGIAKATANASAICSRYRLL